MYAVIKTGGKQYKVAAGDHLRVEKLPGGVGDAVVFDQVLLVGGETVKLGQPLVGGAKVEAKIVTQGLGKKLVIFKFRRRKNYRRKTGHRQPFTVSRNHQHRRSDEVDAMAHKKGAQAARATASVGARSGGVRRSTAARRSPPAAASSFAKWDRPSTRARTSGSARTYAPLFALVDGLVKYEWRTRTQRKVSVYPEA